MGKMGINGYGPSAGNWNQLNGKKLGGMAKWGRMACFHVVNFYESNVKPRHMIPHLNLMQHNMIPYLNLTKHNSRVDELASRVEELTYHGAPGYRESKEECSGWRG